jgi:ABC-2 type transport system ATP-binding protein
VCYAQRSQWSFASKAILKSISLEVFRGESFGFLGHNGAGKTTTIKCLLNFLRPQSGVIRLNGKHPSDTSSRAQVGYVPELPYFYEHLSVSEVVTLSAQLHTIAPAFRKKAISKALELVKLDARKNSPLRSLSKGLTQRVALAQAIVAEPTLLILDEPFSGLDPIGRKEFRDIFGELKAKGTTIFISSHILSDVEFVCDRASILSQGELKGVFDIKKLPELLPASYVLGLKAAKHQRPTLQSLGVPAKEIGDNLEFHFERKSDADAALRRVLDLGMAIDSFETKQGSLEHLFVSLVQFNEANSK